MTLAASKYTVFLTLDTKGLKTKVSLHAACALQMMGLTICYHLRSLISAREQRSSELIQKEQISRSALQFASGFGSQWMGLRRLSPLSSSTKSLQRRSGIN